MRLRDITVLDAPPVELFEARDLSDVIVIAGPNGVGKTRLIQHVMAHLRGASPGPTVTGAIEATTKLEREAWGGRQVIDLSSVADMDVFRASLQANRRRHYLRSSLVNFESDRSVQNLPAAPTDFRQSGSARGGVVLGSRVQSDARPIPRYDPFNVPDDDCARPGYRQQRSRAAASRQEGDEA